MAVRHDEAEMTVDVRIKPLSMGCISRLLRKETFPEFNSLVAIIFILRGPYVTVYYFFQKKT